MGKSDDDRLGNLVHELTHVSVDRAYDRAFVNYTGDLGNKQRLTKEEEWRGKGYGSEEEYLQGSYWNILEATKFLSNKLGMLIELAKDKKQTALKQEQLKLVVDKLGYGQVNANRENDTVLNQIYMWMYIWKTNTKTNLYIEISNAEREAYNRRITRQSLVYQNS